MHFPFQYTLFDETYYYHFIFETLAFIVGIRVYYYFIKKKGIQLLAVAVIAFIIGFSTCLANFSLNLH